MLSGDTFRFNSNYYFFLNYVPSRAYAREPPFQPLRIDFLPRSRSQCCREIFTLMSWLSNEPKNVCSLLFATNYWTSVLMHVWIRIFVTRLFGNLFCLFQYCPCNYQTNRARVRATGIVGISTDPLNRADTFFSDTFLSTFLITRCELFICT